MIAECFMVSFKFARRNHTQHAMSTIRQNRIPQSNLGGTQDKRRELYSLVVLSLLISIRVDLLEIFITPRTEPYTWHMWLITNNKVWLYEHLRTASNNPLIQHETITSLSMTCDVGRRSSVGPVRLCVCCVSNIESNEGRRDGWFLNSHELYSRREEMMNSRCSTVTLYQLLIDLFHWINHFSVWSCVILSALHSYNLTQNSELNANNDLIQYGRISHTFAEYVIRNW